MNKIRLISLLIIISILLCSCGSSDEPDGIDSVTYISEIGQHDNAPVPETTIDPLSVLGGNTLAACNGAEYSSSLYILFMKEAFDSILEKYDISPEDVPKTEVLLSDGSVLTGKEYCETYAKEEYEWVCLLFTEYLKGGKKLSESAFYQDASSVANQDYKINAKKYSKLGISLNDLILYNIYTDLYYEDFLILRSPGSENAISESELSLLMENNVRKISYTYLPLYDEASNEDFSASDKKEMLKLSEEYLDRYKKGESFLDIVSENYMYLDSFNLVFDSDKPYLYYTVYEPMLPAGITDQVELMCDNEAAIVISDDYVSVVMRMPVNEIKDDAWYSCALEQAFHSSYGDKYADEMSNLYDTIEIEYNENLLNTLTLENYIKETYE